MTGPDATLRLERLLGTGVRECRDLGGQHGVRHCRATLDDGRVVFAKIAGAAAGGAAGAAAGGAASPAGGAAGAAAGDSAGFEAEARGLRWLGEAGAVPVPEVVGWDEAALVISWLPEEAPSRQAAERFGRDLARMHAAGAQAYGAPWPGVIAGLPLGNDPGDSWPEWYAAERLLPFARRAGDAGSLTPADVRLVEAVAARIADLARAGRGAEPDPR